ncbi:MAG: hypothetical protein M0015_05275 [Betaproteobacteria bacterium]|nr:hypothetical protein [Betaproteobacteria bacterium]
MWILVGALGLTTAVNCASSGLIGRKIAFECVIGGIAASRTGAHLARRLSGQDMAVNRVFGAVLVAVALYMLVRGIADAP